MADNKDEAPREFTVCVVYLGPEKVRFPFLGRICATVEQDWDNGILRQYVLYETSDGQFVRTALVLEKHSNQCGAGKFLIADIFDTPECACASLADEKLRAKLLRQVAEHKSKFSD